MWNYGKFLFVSNYYVESCELLDTSLPGYLGENSDIIIPFSSPATAYERCKLGNFPINDNDNLRYLAIMMDHSEKLKVYLNCTIISLRARMCRHNLRAKYENVDIKIW